MYIECIKDDSPLFDGTHKGADSSTFLFDPGADFKSCGAMVGSVIYNDTSGAHGLITSVTEDTVEVTLSSGSYNHWNKGDEYSIYATATKDGKISKIYTDKRYGRKVTEKKQLVGGLFPEDIDLDEYNDEVFGPGQPRLERMK